MTECNYSFQMMENGLVLLDDKMSSADNFFSRWLANTIHEGMFPLHIDPLFQFSTVYYAPRVVS